MGTLRSIVFYVLLFIGTILFGLWALAISHLTKNSDRAHLVARRWGNFNLRVAGVKVRLSGLENIAPDKPYIFAANHQSWFDIFAVLGKLPVQFRWLAKEELFSVFVLGRAMKASGYIPIDRTDHRKAFASINGAAERVRNGTSVVIFPEGTRSPNGVIQEFKKGGFVLAVKSEQPIVPISISGSYKILPKQGGWKIHPGTILMTIGQPIPTTGVSNRDRTELMNTVREAISKHLTPEEAGDSLYPGPSLPDAARL
jgi:1-acyl-sn-glycerol-3-phosphate acyltransferase